MKGTRVILGVDHNGSEEKILRSADKPKIGNLGGVLYYETHCIFGYLKIMAAAKR